MEMIGKRDLEDVLYEKNFQKVKAYIKEHGKTPAIIIAQETGVPVSVIDRFLRQGRVEIPEGEEKYIHCERCGADIRYGRFCPECAAELGKQLQVSLNYGEIGETPKAKKGNEGKMYFLNKDKKDKGR